jgi:hypothetical protein
MQLGFHLKLQTPTVELSSWENEAILWKQLVLELDCNLNLSSLESKLIYLLGTLLSINESVGCLLIRKDFARQISYVPAYGIYASAIELLGRSVRGEIAHHKSCLVEGLKWLSNPSHPNYLSVSENHPLIQTSQKSYSLSDLRSLRNYSAHGQATADYCNIDYEIISSLHPIFKAAISCYCSALSVSDELCNNLAKANIVPLRGMPILKAAISINEVSDCHSNLGSIFDRFDTLLRL